MPVVSGRRQRILSDAKFSKDKLGGGAQFSQTVQSGVRELPIVAKWRKPIAFALIPGVDYTKFLPSGSVAGATAAKKASDSNARLSALEKEKVAQLSDIAFKMFNENVLERLDPVRRQRVTLAWESKYGDTYRKREAAAIRQLEKESPPTSIAFNRAKIAMMFFMRWLHKTRLREKIVASPYLEGTDTSQGIFPVLSAMTSENSANAVIQYLQQSNARSGSMWDFLRSTYNIALWDLAILAAPSCVKIDTQNNILSRAGEGKPGSGALTTYVSKPISFFGLPPSCNVYFPSMYDQLSFQENYATQPTRTYIDDSTPARMLGMDANSVFSFYSSAKAAYPGVVDNKLFEDRTKRASKNSKDVVVYPEELYRGPVTNRMNTPTWFYFLYKNTINQKVAKVRAAAATVATQVQPLPVPKLIGGKVLYTRGGQTFELPYVDDGKSLASTGPARIFSQNGYYQSKPIRFNAVNLDGQIVHETLAKSLIAARQEAKKQGIDLVVAEGFATTAEQVLKADGTPTNSPGKSLSQCGCLIKLNILSKDQAKVGAWLTANASKYGFSTTAEVGVLIHSKAVAEVAVSVADSTTTTGVSTNALAKRLPLTSPKYVLDNLKIKNEARVSPQQLTGEHSIYYKYAKYEHYREKYSSRVVSVSGVFNPYVLPGFPIFIFGQEDSNMFLVGHVTSITHSINNGGGATTQVQVTHVRTFNEMFEAMNVDREALAVAPIDPVREVSDRFQRFGEARAYYKQLLYGNEAFYDKDPLGDYQALIGFANNDAPPDRIYADIRAQDSTQYNVHSEYDRELAALVTAKKMFNDTNAALEYCSRPVCTMEEYIDFHGGIRRVGPLPGDRLNRDYVSDHRFYYQIREFPHGEGLVESNDPTVDGLSSAEQISRMMKLPATLRDWAASLLIYRQKIYRG